MTRRPYTPGLPSRVARPSEGRTAGNVAVPESNTHTREAACRKDHAFA
ncbi:hypothetical protein SAMN05660976_02704 [Nonomuraea pusilla]|uniref:Uncharacterized protein n=1 Tax=Nonomuraea pusilla TaxID=46177 RepID=A0A1H7QWH5_9ACTN|nr:hypothetical protein SAMN05660976_02704 [Nonomuraea pusilla]